MSAMLRKVRRKNLRRKCHITYYALPLHLLTVFFMFDETMSHHFKPQSPLSKTKIPRIQTHTEQITV